MKQNIKRNILIGLMLVLAGIVSVGTFADDNTYDTMDPNYMGFDGSTDVTVGDTVYYDIWVDVNQEIDTASIDNMTFNADVINYEPNTVFGDLFGGSVVQMTPEGNGEINNVTGYATSLVWGHSTSVNNTNSTLATIEITAVGCGVSTFSITNGGTALSGIDPGTTMVDKDINVHPQAITGLDSTLVGDDQIDLSWTKNTGDDYTLVRYDTSGYPSTITEGTEAYNGTGSSYSHTSLTPGLTYYYSAWGYNTASGFYSLTEDTVSQQTNQPPEVVTASADPSDTEINVAVTLSNVQVGITDPDGDPLDWTIEVSNGDSSSGTSESNGTKSCPITSNLDYDTTYTWWVNITDGVSTDNEVFTFTTVSNQGPNAPTNPSPADGSYTHPYNLTELSCTVTDPEGDSMDVEFFIDGIGSVGSETGVASGETATVDISTHTFNFNSTYTWHVVVSDSYVGNSDTTGPDWEANTLTESVSGLVSPETRNFGVMDWDDEKSSTITITNTGNSIIDVEMKADSIMFNGDYEWQLGATPSKDNFTVKIYHSSSGTTTLTNTYQEVYSSLGDGDSVALTVRLHIPTTSEDTSEYDDAMEGALDVRFSDGDDVVVGEYEFSCSPPVEGAELALIEEEDVVFIEGGILSADTFYLSIPSDMTADTEIEMPETYSKKHWVFWRQDTEINSIKIIGIDNKWQFKPVDYEGDVDDTITLDVEDMDEWTGFLIVPNPGYFQTSDWWFDVLNDPRDMFVTGESLI